MPCGPRLEKKPSGQELAQYLACSPNMARRPEDSEDLNYVGTLERPALPEVLEISWKTTTSSTDDDELHNDHSHKGRND
ncbi:hypothetical protein U9M48_033807 [Paspalum notatum var. saurae]|uniref:Uncharacterized protein n=1 Tax=Paspalum notatum var. saurae TaxID=547442 RepID=A0AAQ3X6Z6_PASNO